MRSYKGTSAFKLLKVAQPDRTKTQTTPPMSFFKRIPPSFSHEYAKRLAFYELELLFARNAVIVTIHLRARAIL